MAEALKTYKAVKVEKGRGGWGGPLTVKPSPQKPYVVSITGGGIHPLAQRIAEIRARKRDDRARADLNAARRAAAGRGPAPARSSGEPPPGQPPRDGRPAHRRYSRRRGRFGRG